MEEPGERNIRPAHVDLRDFTSCQNTRAASLSAAGVRHVDGKSSETVTFQR